MSKITALIPCFNEASGIASVIASFPSQKLQSLGYELDIVVIDNNSTDDTARIATQAGARVIAEPQQGKGHAIRRGMYNIPTDTDFVVMLDGDNTYKASEILRLIEPLECGFADAILGSRLGGKMRATSMPATNRLGNWLFSYLVRRFYKSNVNDVLTGYFAWTHSTILELRQYLRAPGFAIEMEMITKMARLNKQVYCVPISYEQRQGESSLKPFKDGSRILKMLLKNLAWHPRPHRIAFVSDAVLPYHTGVKEKRLQEVSTRLVREGREVHIYTMKWWTGPKTIMHEGVHFHAISKLRPMYAGDKRSIREAVLFGLACLKLWRARFEVIDVDHMPFFPLFSVWLICKLRGKKLYGTWHEVWGREYWQQYLGIAGKMGFFTERLSFLLPDTIISNSPHTTRQLMAAKVRKPITTIPLGVDLQEVFMSEPNADTSDVIFAGRLLSHKNVDVLLHAIAALRRIYPSVRCVIIGNGPERNNLEQLAVSLGLERHVTFYNFVVEHTEVLSLMKASRVLVLPSSREGFGIVAIEAMACGLPVITVDEPHNAAKDLIVEGVNGYVTPLNADAIAAQICSILTGETVQSREQLAGKAGQYHWQTVASELERVFAL